MILTIALDKRKESIFTKSGLISAIVRWYTKSEYSHVEMIIGDKWIASGNPAGTGVSIKELRPLDDDNWDYYNIEVDGRKTKKVMKFLESQVGTSYDWAGIIFGATLDYNIDDKSKWYCSELVAEVLKMYGVNEFQYLETARVTPDNIYQIIKAS